MNLFVCLCVLLICLLCLPPVCILCTISEGRDFCFPPSLTPSPPSLPSFLVITVSVDGQHLLVEGRKE